MGGRVTAWKTLQDLGGLRRSSRGGPRIGLV
jgi:hypothetical protein